MFLQPDQKKWYPATIVELCKEPRSYIVQTPDKVNYRRTEQHIKAYNPQGHVKVERNLPQLPMLQEERPRRSIKAPKKLNMLNEV